MFSSDAALAVSDVQGRADLEAERRATHALMLFTDSKANRGITHRPSLVHEAREQLQHVGERRGHIIINTMGYGADHNETQLRELADEFGGRCARVMRRLASSHGVHHP